MILQKANENVKERQVAIGLKFEFDWLYGWYNLFMPILE